ncbi:MAG TPA: sigma-70 family RNA polymerase sigma factor [Terriglobales bacterium]|jgi:RNA polymerase sigma-70 factor (ECF subfamily)
MKSSTQCSSDEDLPLVVASKCGDPSVFAELITRYDRKLFRIACTVTHCDRDAEEVVEATFLKVYRNLARFQGDMRFSTWLVRIVLNESFMNLRKQRSVREDSTSKLSYPRYAQSPPGSWARPHFDTSDWVTNPELLYGTVELRKILQRSLRKLRVALRVVFVLRDMEGHSITETSAILNVTAKTVQTRLSLARLQLRQELTQYFKKTG